MRTRRSLLGTVLGLGLAGGAAWVLRDRLFWPTATIAGEAGDSGPIAFVDGRTRLALIPVRLNGRETVALIDSGAQASIIDRQLAETLALPSAPTPPLIALGAGGGGGAARGVDVRLEVGGLSFSRVRAGVLELGPLSEPVGGAAGMVIGQDVLQTVTADLDFPGRTARLRAGSLAPAPGSAAAPVQPSGRGLEARLRVEETVLDVLVDTGATSALTLTRSTAEAVGLFDGREMRPATSIVLGGAATGLATRAERLVFAGETYEAAEVHVIDDHGVPGFPRGLLGLGVLGRWRVRLDLGGGRMGIGGQG